MGSQNFEKIIKIHIRYHRGNFNQKSEYSVEFKILRHLEKDHNFSKIVKIHLHIKLKTHNCNPNQTVLFHFEIFFNFRDTKGQKLNSKF